MRGHTQASPRQRVPTECPCLHDAASGNGGHPPEHVLHAPAAAGSAEPSGLVAVMRPPASPKSQVVEEEVPVSDGADGGRRERSVVDRAPDRGLRRHRAPQRGEPDGVLAATVQLRVAGLNRRPEFRSLAAGARLEPVEESASSLTRSRRGTYPLTRNTVVTMRRARAPLRSGGFIGIALRSQCGSVDRDELRGRTKA